MTVDVNLYFPSNQITTENHSKELKTELRRDNGILIEMKGMITSTVSLSELLFIVSVLPAIRLKQKQKRLRDK